MTVYTWGNQKNIDRVEVVPHGKKAKEAVIYASAETGQGELAKLPECLRALGLNVIPDEKDGQFILRVRGFESDEFLTAALEKNGFVSGQPQSQESAKGEKAKRKGLGGIKEQSVKLAGITYLIGDASLILSGMIRGDMNEAKSGLGYMSASAVLARYGNRKPEKAFDDLYTRMLKEFTEEGVELPDMGTTAEELSKPGGMIERIEGFLYKHPVEVNRAVNAFGGYQLFRAGSQQNNPFKKTAGAFAVTGMLVALLVPEKKKEAAAVEGWNTPDVKDKKSAIGKLFTPVTKVTDWVQNDPMKAGSYLGIINNFSMAAGVPVDKKKNDANRAELKDRLANFQVTDEASQLEHDALAKEVKGAERGRFGWAFSLAAASAYFTANALMSVSKGGAKDANKLDPYEDLYAASAAILAAQPEAERNAVINKMASYLSAQREIEAPASEIASKMREKITTLEQSPWLAKATQQKAQPAQGAAR